MRRYDINFNFQIFSHIFSSFLKNLFDLTGKYSIVTGASSGLGRHAALSYASMGANVALLARNINKLKEVEAEIKKYNVKTLLVECDVTKEESVKKAVETVMNNFERVDILLNNAGVAVSGGVDTLSEDDWDRSFNTNVKGMYFMSKYVIPVMKKQNYGKVVNVASVNAIVGDKEDIFIRHSYNASKAAVLGLTKGMACSYAKYNITVNAVGPGLFETGMTKDTLFKSEEFLNAYNKMNPSNRPGKEGEVSGPILFLSSDASSYVQGQFIVIDGGGSSV